MKNDEVRDQLREKIQDIIHDEIQDGINDYIDSGNPEGFGKDDKLNVKISNDEVDKIIKQYKKETRRRKSNLFQAKKLGLVDKHGRPLDAK
mgnify:FL=1|tara:strand:- start:321 stop:593 length:273 start_codon:yes stop_codon:yes gene_type:complete